MLKVQHANGSVGVRASLAYAQQFDSLLDQLAAESLRLTQFLVEPECTPSHAALMTGRYSIRSGLSLIAVAGSPNSLPATEITMAEMLREAGYATAMFGKWHLGDQPHSTASLSGPNARAKIRFAVAASAVHVAMDE